MIDRYTLTLNADELTLVLGAEVPDRYVPEYNAAPTKSLPILTSHSPDRLIFQKWGLMAMWSNNKAMSPKFFNLPFDSILKKPGYRRKLNGYKCVIPMDGFYVWKQVAKKRQVPYYFYYADRKVFSVAGLWEENDEGGNSFIMITKPANHLMSPYQEDMPAIMDTANSRKWLGSNDHEELLMLLAKNPKQELKCHTVSPKIGDILLNDVSMIKPAPASDQHGNYTLFT